MDFSSSGKEPGNGNTKSGTRESIGFSSGRLIGPQQTESLISLPPLSFLSADQGRDKAAGEMESGWT